MRASARTRQVESSNTMMPPEPDIEPAAFTASTSSEMSISSPRSTGEEEPPEMTAFTLRPPGIPPQSSMMSFFKLYAAGFSRSEEHTSELQSREKLVCRLLLEKK